MKGKWRALGANQSGSMAVSMGGAFILLLMFAALVVDFGHIYSVKREMQKAAEAGAIAGATGVQGQLSDTTWQWGSGTTDAVTTVQKNTVDTVSLSDFNASTMVTLPDGAQVAQVEEGYWNITWDPSSAPDHLNGYQNPSSYTVTDTLHEYPAVKVTLQKNTGHTGSSAAVTNFFASIFGSAFGTQNLHTSAVALTLAGVNANTTFPMALPESYLPGGADGPPGYGPDYTFEITPDGTPSSSDWTSFAVQSNNVPTIENLINTGNPTILNIGQDIWVAPGDKNTLYNAANGRDGQTMLFAVINNPQSNNWNPIVSFVAFHIITCNNGSNPYIKGYFVNNYTDKNGNTMPSPFKSRGIKLVQ